MRRPSLWGPDDVTQAEESEDEESGRDSIGAYSQDMLVDDILSGITTNVTSREPPTPRQVQRA